MLELAWYSQSVGQPASQSVSQPASQPASQSVSQSVNQPANQSVQVQYHAQTQLPFGPEGIVVTHAVCKPLRPYDGVLIARYSYLIYRLI